VQYTWMCSYRGCARPPNTWVWWIWTALGMISTRTTPGPGSQASAGTRSLRAMGTRSPFQHSLPESNLQPNPPASARPPQRGGGGRRRDRESKEDGGPLWSSSTHMVKGGGQMGWSKGFPMHSIREEEGPAGRPPPSPPSTGACPFAATVENDCSGFNVATST
jgi:hypothetical protein